MTREEMLERFEELGVEQKSLHNNPYWFYDHKGTSVYVPDSYIDYIIKNDQADIFLAKVAESLGKLYEPPKVNLTGSGAISKIDETP